MLVSSIVRFNAAQAMNNAAFGMMQTSSKLNNAMTNNTFGGEHDLSMLNKLDKKLSLDLASNSLLYKINDLQEKMAKKRQEHDIKRSFSTFA